MPVYEYRCDKGHTFEVLQRMSDDPVTVRSTCEAPGQRASHDTHGPRTNSPGQWSGEATFERIDESTCCCLAARARSSSFGAQRFLRTRENASASLPLRWCSPFLRRTRWPLKLFELMHFF